MAIALGRTETDEYAQGLHKVGILLMYMVNFQVSATLKGQRGLMFTNLSVKEVIR